MATQSVGQDAMPLSWQHDKELASCMIELYKKNLWTDVKFICKDADNTTFHAHKIVLAARSPVFQAKFFGPCTDGKNEVEFDNADASIFDLFLRYLYSDETTLNEDTAPAVLELAHFYQVTNLVQYSADYLATLLTTQNACRFLTIALTYQVASLRDATSAFIDDNAAAVLESEDFLDLSEECLRYILKGDTFYAEEKAIFRKAEAWAVRKLKQNDVEQTSQNIKEVLGKTFYELRLPTMTVNDLMECTRRKGYLSLEEYEDIIDFISRGNEPSAKSNSYIFRLNINERRILTDEVQDSEEEKDGISSSLRIFAKRDIYIVYIELSEIQPYLRYKDYVYKRNSYTSVRGELLNNNLAVPVDVCIEIRSLQAPMKINNANNSSSFGKESSNEGGYTDCRQSDQEDDRHQATLIFEQKFQIPFSKLSNKISLKEPVLLTKEASPYALKLSVKYSNAGNMRMMVRKKANLESPFAIDDKSSCSIDTIRRKPNLEFENIEGNFVGIRSLGFQNVSNRENCC